MFNLNYLLLTSLLCNHLFSSGELDAIAAEIVDGIPLSEESITQDSQRTSGSRDIL